MILATQDTHAMLITMVTAISAGVMLIVAAKRMQVSSIVLLLVGGFLLGPSGVGIVRPDSLGDGLGVIVSLAVGLILFEGGLTLDLAGYRTAPRMIKRLLSVGVVITWLGAASAIRSVIGLPWELAIVAGSLVIVTGPTVIAPLLNRVRIIPKLHGILHWEGVLIDPIGVFIAILCFEWISGAGGQAAVTNLVVRVAAGLGIGAAGGAVLMVVFRRKLVPEEMINVFALAFAVLIFGLAESVRSEAGLLAVTAAGFVFGLSHPTTVRQVCAFKAEITELLIGTIFILLAARLSLDQFRAFGVEGALVVALVMFAVRPLSILVCSWRLDLTTREKAFLGWVAPRGIVAASMASLFAISMERMGTFDNPKFIETFTYSVIVGTIVLQGLTVGPVASLLALRQPTPDGWLVVGAHVLGRRVATFIRDVAKLPVMIVDTNVRAVRAAREAGLPATMADARETSMVQRVDMRGVGNVLALTDNEDLNVRICRNWAAEFGADHVYRGDPTATGEDEDDSIDRVGTLLWLRLPRPSIINSELLRGEARLMQTSAPSKMLARSATPLISVVDGKVTFDPPAEERPDDAENPIETLYLRRRADYLRRSVLPELVVILEPDGVEELFRDLVGRIAEQFPDLPEERTLEKLLKQERVVPTIIGNGVALPHVLSTALDRRVCAIAQIPRGMRFSAEDEASVRLVFLLLSPRGDPEGHLATLAEIARMVSDDAVRLSLIEAATPRELLQIVRKASRA